jgi:hypothetical protein
VARDLSSGQACEVQVESWHVCCCLMLCYIRSRPAVLVYTDIPLINPAASSAPLPCYLLQQTLLNHYVLQNCEGCTMSFALTVIVAPIGVCCRCASVTSMLNFSSECIKCITQAPATRSSSLPVHAAGCSSACSHLLGETRCPDDCNVHEVCGLGDQANHLTVGACAQRNSSAEAAVVVMQRRRRRGL